MTKRRTYPRRGLHGAVVHEIGVRILDGELKPGDTLPDNGSLTESEVSRTVVREAIKVLAAKGLVESRPKVGTRVRQRRDWNLLDPDVLAWLQDDDVSEEMLHKLTEVRRIIEPAAAELAAARAGAADVAELERALAEMDAATRPRSADDV